MPSFVDRVLNLEAITKWVVKKVKRLNVKPADDYADDAAAAAGGIPIGHLYHTSGTVKIRLT
jgi:hypothetical protein